MICPACKVDHAMLTLPTAGAVECDGCGEHILHGVHVSTCYDCSDYHPPAELNSEDCRDDHARCEQCHEERLRAVALMDRDDARESWGDMRADSRVGRRYL